VRYRGQAHELGVPAAPLASLADRFHRAHERRYGFADPTREVLVVTLDVRGFLAASLPAGRPPARTATGTALAVRVHDGGRERTAALWARSALAPGARVTGPAVVADDGATLWIAPGWRGRVHSTGALVLERGGRR
jgi:N-methylhydantoinase A/oxoprolinase/acetone carboxylase beta subunit